MTDLLWPGDHRAGDLLTDASLVAAIARVEEAWLEVLADEGLAPTLATEPGVAEAAASIDLDLLADLAETTGAVVAPLVELVRDHPGVGRETARWLHRGLTTQDVLDTALALETGAALDRLEGLLGTQVSRLVALVERHRDTPMLARTLTQPAVPTTFGLRAAQWLSAVLDAVDGLDDVRLPAQVGGAAGTLAAVTELAAGDVAVARRCVERLAGRLGLEPVPPWHTTRSRVTRLGDALVACHDACGRIAGDVLVGSRAEVGELREGAGGGSSTMPDKHNPVLSLLVRRAALAAPALGSLLHLAAAEATEERPAGAWHLEWAPLRDLARRAVVAADQTADLLDALDVDAARMAENLARFGSDAEQRAMAELAGRDPRPDYLGAAGALVDDVLERAATLVQRVY